MKQSYMNSRPACGKQQPEPGTHHRYYHDRQAEREDTFTTQSPFQRFIPRPMGSHMQHGKQRKQDSEQQMYQRPQTPSPKVGHMFHGMKLQAAEHRHRKPYHQNQVRPINHLGLHTFPSFPLRPISVCTALPIAEKTCVPHVLTHDQHPIQASARRKIICLCHNRPIFPMTCSGQASTHFQQATQRLVSATTKDVARRPLRPPIPLLSFEKLYIIS